MSLTLCSLSECLLVFGLEIPCLELDMSFVPRDDHQVILPLIYTLGLVKLSYEFLSTFRLYLFLVQFRTQHRETYTFWPEFTNTGRVFHFPLVLLVENSTQHIYDFVVARNALSICFLPYHNQKHRRFRVFVEIFPVLDHLLGITAVHVAV